MVKNLAAEQETWVQSLVQEDPHPGLEKIPWRREWQPTPGSFPGNPMD